MSRLTLEPSSRPERRATGPVAVSLALTFFFACLGYGCSGEPQGGSRCGNGIVEEGEVCDGSCPISCDDGVDCTRDVLVGSAADCSARCSFTVISTCADGDGCCPEGCAGADSDCPVPEPCGEGAVVDPCECGGAIVSEGFCCGGVWQPEDCIFIETREAEEGITLGQMTGVQAVLADPACGDAWIEVTAEVEDFVWNPESPSLPAHRTELSFDLPQAGTYYVWLRMASRSESRDALYAGFEAADMRRVFPPDAYPYDGSWVWVSEVSGASDRLVFPGLAAGAHTLVIAHGEAQTRCDKVAVSDVPNAAFELACGPANECSDGDVESQSCPIEHGSGVETRSCDGGAWGAYGGCEATGCDAGYHIEDNRCVEGPGPEGEYPFQGYSTTRGAFQALQVEGEPAPRVLIVDRLDGSRDSGDEDTGRGSLPWALTRTYPRIILFEVSGVIRVGEQLSVTSPYASVHGQTAPPPGVTLYDVEMLIRTHDVIFQHLRVRMGGDAPIGGGDPLGVCGASGDTVHDIIIDHCSAGLGHDEQLSISSCGEGDVRRVTLSNNIISFGLNYNGHGYGTLIDSGGGNDFGVDGVLVDGNLFSQVSYRTPLLGPAARRVTITNNAIYNYYYHNIWVRSAQYPEGQFVDIMNNLNWRGPETYRTGTWPTDEAEDWPAHPETWPWEAARRAVFAFTGLSGEHTHVYYENNYDYVNNRDYDFGAHEGRPIEIENDWFYEDIRPEDVRETSRQTDAVVALMTPVELETHVLLGVGCTPDNRGPLDARAVSDALARTGGYIDHEADLGFEPLPAGEATRDPRGIDGYPAGTELGDSDGDGLSDLEEWIYAL